MTSKAESNAFRATFDRLAPAAFEDLWPWQDEVLAALDAREAGRRAVESRLPDMERMWKRQPVAVDPWLVVLRRSRK